MTDVSVCTSILLHVRQLFIKLVLNNKHFKKKKKKSLIFVALRLNCTYKNNQITLNTQNTYIKNVNWAIYSY